MVCIKSTSRRSHELFIFMLKNDTSLHTSYTHTHTHTHTHTKREHTLHICEIKYEYLCPTSDQAHKKKFFLIQSFLIREASEKENARVVFPISIEI